jgi:glucan phosphoethanolaminetransferase (alkaline phosphatase superfamily)
MKPIGTDWKARLAVFAAALWWGSLTAIGFLVVPLLFTYLPSAALAGNTAARLFSAQTWVTLGCGLLLLLVSRSRDDSTQMDWARGALLFVVAGVLLALLSEFAVAPRIVARQNLKLWHGIGSAMYVLQWLCAGLVLWKLTDPGSRQLRA